MVRVPRVAVVARGARYRSHAVQKCQRLHIHSPPPTSHEGRQTIFNEHGATAATVASPHVEVSTIRREARL